MTMRLSISSLAATARTLVAVGTPRLVSMFCAVRAAAPRSRVTSAPAGGGGAAGLGAGAAGLAGAAGAAGATGTLAATAASGDAGRRRRSLSW